MGSNTSKMWPYVLAGSAVGGAVGLLFITKSGGKVRHAITHPDEIAENLDDARMFLERKAKGVTERVRTVLDKAKEGMAAGQRAFHEAEAGFRANTRKFENKSNEIASTVHKNVDNLNKTACNVEQAILDPIFEAGAIYKGIQRGVRTFLGKQGHVTQFNKERA
jgi:gas vesicle protein